MFFAKLRASISNNFIYALEALCALFGISGIAGAIFFGKMLLALILACLTVAVLFRLAGRRTPKTKTQADVPAWKRAITLLLSVICSALLVEAINLPVRFDQPHFDYLHWGLAVALVVAFYLLFKRLQSPAAKTN
jgi:hypothetical protein